MINYFNNVYQGKTHYYETIDENMKELFIDRFEYATKLSAGKRVLDIGGALMPGTDPDHPFAKAYSKISIGAKEYKVVDYQDLPTVDYILDLNYDKNVKELEKIIEDYKPEVILCMEFLEHINYHYEIMQVLARAVGSLNSVVLITLPNSDNWFWKLLGWDTDHVMGFNRGTATNLITRSNLGKHNVKYVPLVSGKYKWYWFFVHILTFCQSFSLAFEIRKKE